MLLWMKQCLPINPERVSPPHPHPPLQFLARPCCVEKPPWLVLHQPPTPSPPGPPPCYQEPGKWLPAYPLQTSLDLVVPVHLALPPRRMTQQGQTLRPVPGDASSAMLAGGSFKQEVLVVNTALATAWSLPSSRNPMPTLPVPWQVASRHMLPSMPHSITAQALGNL